MERSALSAQHLYEGSMIKSVTLHPSHICALIVNAIVLKGLLNVRWTGKAWYYLHTRTPLHQKLKRPHAISRT